MKYLVHLRPSGEFSGEIQTYRNRFSRYIKKIFKNSLHVTLMTIWFNPEDEGRVVQTLNGIICERFNAEADKLELFDENSLVVRLRKRRELMKLHTKIINALKTYVNWRETPEFNADKNRMTAYQKYGSPYYAEFYNPHLTIAQVDPKIFFDEDFDVNQLNGKSWSVSAFYLSKREASGWKQVRRFSLQ